MRMGTIAKRTVYPEYEIRDLLLQDLAKEGHFGIKWVKEYKEFTYKRYLYTSLWKNEIRPMILEKYEFQCQTCCLVIDDYRLQRFLQVHHQEYTRENLLGESQKGLLCVCESCHRKAEGVLNKKDNYYIKYRLEEVNRILTTVHQPNPRFIEKLSNILLNSKEGVQPKKKRVRKKKNNHVKRSKSYKCDTAGCNNLQAVIGKGKDKKSCRFCQHCLDTLPREVLAAPRGAWEETPRLTYSQKQTGRRANSGI